MLGLLGIEVPERMQRRETVEAPQLAYGPGVELLFDDDQFWRASNSRNSPALFTGTTRPFFRPLRHLPRL